MTTLSPRGIMFLKEGDNMTWEKFLERFGCYKDAVGNRPCDNGAMCDQCSQSWVLNEFAELNEKEKEAKELG